MKKIYLVCIFISLLAGRVNSQHHSYSRENDSIIITALSMVNADSMLADMQNLQDMGTRFMIAQNHKEVATWIMNKFLSYGLTEVRLDSFICQTNINFPPLSFDTTTWQYNVEAKISGTDFPENEVVILSHHDAITNTGAPLIFAPGADDNASGTAAVMECARVIAEMGYQPQQTMIFLTAAAEELMYYGEGGTEHYAQEALEEGRNITMVFSNDEISFDDGAWTMDVWNHILSPEITAMAIYVIENYTSLNYVSQPPEVNVGSNIQPFLDAGYHGIYFREHVINPDFHTPDDLVENCNIPYLAEMCRVNLGCLLQSDIMLGQDEPGKTDSQIQVYPNPASKEIVMSIKDQGISGWDVRIIGMNGTELYHDQYIPGSYYVDVSYLPSGLYMMIFSNGKEIQFKRLVVRSELR